MAIVAKDSGESFERELPSAGLQHAVLSKIFDLGLQMNNYTGKHQHKVLFVWELAETMSEGKFAGNRFILTQEFTLSLNEKANLRKMLESWKGKQMTEEQAKQGVELEKFLKVQATLNVIHAEKRDGGEYAKVSTVLPAQSDAPVLFPELDDDWCPDWIAAKMNAGFETNGAEVGDVSQRQQETAEEVPTF